MKQQNIDDLYISVDIETDGPIPFKNSMIDLGASIFDLKNGIIESFEVAVNPLPGNTTDPNTMLEFWSKHIDRYNYLYDHGIEAKQAMERFVNWVERVSGGKKPVFIAYPAGYDFTWTYAYMMYFVGRSPFGFVALDFKSLLTGYLKVPYRSVAKRNMPKKWFSKELKHTHNAVEDAAEQAELFINAMREIYEMSD